MKDVFRFLIFSGFVKDTLSAVLVTEEDIGEGCVPIFNVQWPCEGHVPFLVLVIRQVCGGTCLNSEVCRF